MDPQFLLVFFTLVKNHRHKTVRTKVEHSLVLQMKVDAIGLMWR